MNTEARFTFQKVRHDKHNDAHLILTLKAPTIDWQSKRQPVCVIPVIDVSGSMQGEKIAYTKQSVMKLIDNLKPGDYCGLIVFGNDAREIAAPAEMTQSRKDELKAKVGALNPNEMTNFSSGMLMALDRLNKMDVPQGTILRAIMFTDGLANSGVSDPTGITALLDANMGRATVSFFGYGIDANQDLLSDLSTKAKGNYAYVKNPEDALTAFAKELGGLLSTYAQNIKIDLAAYGEHKFVEVVSDVDSESDTDSRLKVKLPDLLSEEERHIVIGVKLAPQKPGPRAVNAIDLTLTYDYIDSTGKMQSATVEAKAKVQFVKVGDEQVKPDEALDLIVSTAKLVQTQLEAERHAKAGNFTAAQNVWANLGTYLSAHDHHNHMRAAGSFRDKYSTAMAYSSSKGFLKSAQKGLTRSVGLSSADAEANQVFTALNVGVANSAQTQMIADFNDASQSAAPAAPPEPSKKPKKSSGSLSKSRSGRW